MSRQALLEGNAKKVGELARQGFKSLFDKHKALDNRGYELWNDGMSAGEIRRTLCREFPNLAEKKEVPSLPSITNRIKNHWQVWKNPEKSSIQTITPHTLKVEELLDELDPIKEVWEFVLPEAKRIYETARDASLSLKARQSALQTYSGLLKMANEMLSTSRVGLAAGVEMQGITNEGGTVNQQITNVTVINNQLSEDANRQNHKAVMEAFKRFQDLEKKMKKELEQAKEGEVVNG